ncbi:hypothetical protein WJX82_007438 [Trebouxia sp. C0006]
MLTQTSDQDAKNKYAAARAAAQALPKKLFINNQFVDGKSGSKLPVVDPRTGETILEIEEGDTEDVDRAVHAASEAFNEGPWPKTAAQERGRMLYRLADLVEENAEELALLETLDVGKPLMEAKMMDIPGFVSFMRYYAGWADKLSGQTLKHVMPLLAYTLREPLGVCALIVPWNFPLGLLGMKLAPALAAGNTVVAKPAEQSMLTTLRLAQLFLEAGFPPGVFNVVTGLGPTVGAALVKHPLVDKVAFTGSTSVGKQILTDAASTMKHVTLECGGKCSLIVCADANIDEAVETAHQAAFVNSGQFCTAGSRLFVHEDIYDEFMAKSVKRAQSRSIGDPFQVTTEQGPIAFKEHFDKVLALIEAGKEEGAKLLTGGHQLGDSGFYIQPTLFGDVRDGMRIAQEEIFGPVQCCMPWRDADEVVRRANNTVYGLAAGVFTNDLDTANYMSRALKVGTVWINSCWFMLSPSVPFGGHKQSGSGVENGQEGIEAYTQMKAVMMPIKRPPWV